MTERHDSASGSGSGAAGGGGSGRGAKLLHRWIGNAIENKSSASCAGASCAAVSLTSRAIDPFFDLSFFAGLADMTGDGTSITVRARCE